MHTVECDRDAEAPHVVALYHVAPDIAMVDFDSHRLNIAQDVVLEKYLHLISSLFPFIYVLEGRLDKAPSLRCTRRRSRRTTPSSP